MARGDLRIVAGSYGVREFDTDDRNTSVVNQLLWGEPVKRGGANNNFAVPIDNGDPEIGTDILLGIVKRDSTETATADGKVEVDRVGPGTVIEGDASTSASIDTAAELLGLMLDFVAFDVSASSVYTIDEDQNGANTQLMLQVVGGDIIRTRVFVQVFPLQTTRST